MHVTRIPLELEKRNKGVQTLHEQVNKIVHSFNRFESSFFKYWPNKSLHSFFCSLHNFKNYFIILIFSIRMLVRTSRVFAEMVMYSTCGNAELILIYLFYFILMYTRIILKTLALSRFQ